MHGLLRSGLVMAVVTALLTAAAQAQAPADFQKVLQEKSPAFVTIKFVLKIKMGGVGESESETETTGAMIDPKGLVITSNTQLGGIAGFMRSMGRDISTTPTDIKVLVGDDIEGLPAKVIARDTELDLAWVQITEPGEKEFAHIDLKDSTDGKVGQFVVTLRRMAKYFDRVTVIGESRVAGVTKKPRHLYVPTLPLTNNLGLPVFTADGKVLGVAVLQMPSEEDEEEGPAGMFSRMSSLQEMMMGMILPATEVIEATRRAQQVAATQSADAEEKATPAEPTDEGAED